MTQNKGHRQKITFSRSYRQAWPKDISVLLQSSIEYYVRHWKYVKVGVTTDYKTQYEQHVQHDPIQWQKIVVKLRTNDVRAIKKLIQTLSENVHYIDNNIHFPQTLFDRYDTYYVYLLLGKRKKGKNAINRHHYTFVVLNDSLGGFNTALTKLGWTRVTKDPVPQHDILCAQLSDDESVEQVRDILIAQDKKKPKYLLLESDAKNSLPLWELTDLGYDMMSEVLSPHQFGIPLHRQRTYIVGIREDMKNFTRFSFPEPNDNVCDIQSIINADHNDNTDHIQPLTLKQHKILKVWQRFIDLCYEHEVSIPRFPVWAMEFGATYSFRKLPQWKKYCISNNRQFYEENKVWIDTWKDSVKSLGRTYQKLEWNVGDAGAPLLKDNIIQFLASGIRVKAPTFSPSLSGALLPIIPWVKLQEECIPEYTPEQLSEYGLTKEDVSYGRYLSISEAARLQGFEKIDFGGLSTNRIYEVISNGVNATMIGMIASKLD